MAHLSLAQGNSVSVKPSTKEKPSQDRASTSPQAKTTNESQDRRQDGNSANDSEKHKPVINFSKVENLPKCEVKTQRPYQVKDGKLACNKAKPSVIKVEDILGLSKNQQENLGKELFVAGKIDDLTVVYSDPIAAPYVVAGISANNKLRWVKSYKQPVTATVIDHKIWVTKNNKITQLIPASRAEVAEENRKGMELVSQDYSVLPNYRAYQAYLKLINEPNESDFSYDSNEYDLSKADKVGYFYELADIDNSGIPALIMYKIAEGDEFEFLSIIRPYLYQADTGKIIKTDIPFIGGTKRFGRFIGFFSPSKDKDGLLYVKFHGGPEGDTQLWQPKSGKIVETHREPFDFEHNASFYDSKRRDTQRVSTLDLKPLRKSLKIRVDKVKDIEQRAHEKAVAEAKQAGDQIFEGEIKIMKAKDIVDKYFPNIRYGFEGLEDHLEQEIAVLFLPQKIKVSAYGGGVPEPRTRETFLINLSYYHKEETDKFRPYHNQKVVIAVAPEDMIWPSDINPTYEELNVVNARIIP